MVDTNDRIEVTSPQDEIMQSARLIGAAKSLKLQVFGGETTLGGLRITFVSEAELVELAERIERLERKAALADEARKYQRDGRAGFANEDSNWWDDFEERYDAIDAEVKGR